MMLHALHRLCLFALLCTSIHCAYGDTVSLELSEITPTSLHTLDLSFEYDTDNQDDSTCVQDPTPSPLQTLTTQNLPDYRFCKELSQSLAIRAPPLAF